MSNKKNEAADVPFSGPYTKGPDVVTDKSGAKHSPMSRVRHLARMAAKKQEKEKPVKEEVEELDEAGLKDACWKGYTAVGMKEKNGKKVPNCVPVKEDAESTKCPVCGEVECVCDDSHGFVEGLKPEHNMRPGWMLKADPELAAKVKKNKEIAKARKASYGNPAAGKSVKEGHVPDHSGVLNKKDSQTMGKLAALMAKERAAKAAKKPVKEEALVEGAYEKAEENKKSADAAKKQGDMFAHHLHMADHHDNMAEWHGSKGRHGEADKHAQKAEEHHEKAMSMKEEYELEEGRRFHGYQSHSGPSHGHAYGGSGFGRRRREDDEYHNEPKKKPMYPADNPTNTPRPIKKEEVEIEESMTDSWKKVQSMDKGSVTGGKEGVKKRLEYLHAVHAHHKKYGNDTKKVKSEIENINRSRIGEEIELEEAKKANTASARAELNKRPRKELTGADADKKKKESDDAWERLMAHAAANKKTNEEAPRKFRPANPAPAGSKSDSPGFQAYLAKRRAEREKAKAVKEEAEQIDELSKTTVSNYKTAAKSDRASRWDSANSGDKAEAAHAKNKISKRSLGIRSANKRLGEEAEQIEERNKENATKRKMMDASRGARYKVGGNPVPDRDEKHGSAQAHNKAIGRALRREETDMEFTQEELHLIEQFIEIAEKMNMSKASMGDVIKDFKASSAPQFKGKSEAKRRQMAIAAKLEADRETKKEETEVVGFKSFMLEYESDKGGRYVHKGKYGSSYDAGSDDDDDKPASSEKRGRGRPKGSSSGARQKGSTTGKKRSGVEMTGYPLHLPNR